LLAHPTQALGLALIYNEADYPEVVWGRLSMSQARNRLFPFNTNKMLKLYGGKWSRATIVKWYLEELGTPYEFVLLDMEAGEHLQPPFLAINPVGKVPAIVDGDLTLWESGAILLYLAEKSGECATIEQRAIASQWVFFANATLAVELFAADRQAQATPRLLTPLNELFAKQSFVLGEQFSVADVAIGSTLSYIQMFLKPDWSAYPAVLSYLQKIMSRPAYQRSMGGK
jgi:glutathione S-transferase